MAERTPVASACEHPSRIIREELVARRWTRNRLAHEMGGEFGINRLALDMFFLVGPSDKRMRMGDEMAGQIAQAFGVSPRFLLNLERVWIEYGDTTPVRAGR